ncbi:hypothetical protein AMC82_PC00029 (plasmid) [Rhizobium phaseoli]|nr:hypothetical protein AMC84_PC00029 [Rhizobium phaseoli]ANL81402.1 hypothetical protein AMC82_PC00029 [Rhizobium phaseoli]
MSVRSSLMKSAEDFSKRANTQIVVVTSGLLLGLFSIMASQQFASSQRYEVLTIDSQGAAMRAQYQLASKERLKTRNHSTAAQIEFDQAGCSAKLTAPGDRCSKLKREIERAGGGEERLTAILKRLDDLAKDIPKKQKDIAARFSEKVSFDVGLGIKLPFTLDIAPLIFLAVSAGLGVFVGIKRARFWQLVGAALRSDPDPVDPVERLALIDVAIWLAPVPLGRDRVGLSRFALARQAGWIRSYRRRHAAMALLVLLLVMVCAYVSYSGLIIVDLLRHMEALQLQSALTPTAARSFDTNIILVILFGANLAVALWLLIPTRISTTVTRPVYVDQQRRIAIRAMVVGSTATVAAALVSPALMERLWSESITRIGQRWNQFRPRRPNHINLRDTSLKPGWYCNTRSNVVHYLDHRLHMRWAKGINPSHLASHIPIAHLGKSHIPIAHAGKIVSKTVATSGSGTQNALKINNRPLEYREAAAINLVLQHQYSEASQALIDAALIELKAGGLIRPTPALRLLDLAAGIAIRYDLRQDMLTIVDEVKQVLVEQNPTSPLYAALNSRLRQWTEPSGENWRRNRWRSQPHPLRWNRGIYKA